MFAQILGFYYKMYFEPLKAPCNHLQDCGCLYNILFPGQVPGQAAGGEGGKTDPYAGREAGKTCGTNNA